MPTLATVVVAVADAATEAQHPGGIINPPASSTHSTPVLSTVNAPVCNCANGMKKAPAFVGVPTRNGVATDAAPPIYVFARLSIAVVAVGADV
jgi:hypothetical protein